MRDVTAERELDRMKQEFFHSIVHDLRSPIASIDGFVSMMKARGLNDKEKRYLDYVRSSIQMLSLLVDNILTAAQIDSGSKVLNVSAVDPPELLDRIRVLYTLQTDRAGIELRLKSPPGPGQSLDCDRGLVERVLMNLVGNALKFTPAKGFIEVRYQADGGTAEFSVTDSGPGIPQDKLGLIFERFRQLDSGAKRSGYGIGLSTCKKIVDLHGGTIWAESKPGQGASFRFRIPASRTAA
jgi:signal transduction histidine kinase